MAPVSRAALDPAPVRSAESSAAVVDGVRAGRVEVLEDIMRRENRRLFRVARAILKSDEEAEDVVQETYVRAFSRIDQFDGRSLLSTWLTRIAINEALGRHRSCQRDRRHGFVSSHGSGDVEESVMSQRAEHPDPEQNAASREMGRLVERAIDELPEVLRTVLMMRVVEQMDTGETAECLGVPPDTVKTRLFRARRTLRNIIEGQIDLAAEEAFPFAGTRCDRVVARVLARLGLSQSS